MQGQEITVGDEAPAEPAQIIDLMAALKASLGQGRGREGGQGRPAKAEADRGRGGGRGPRRGARRSHAETGEAKHAEASAPKPNGQGPKADQPAPATGVLLPRRERSLRGIVAVA